MRVLNGSCLDHVRSRSWPCSGIAEAADNWGGDPGWKGLPPTTKAMIFVGPLSILQDSTARTYPETVVVSGWFGAASAVRHSDLCCAVNPQSRRRDTSCRRILQLQLHDNKRNTSCITLCCDLLTGQLETPLKQLSNSISEDVRTSWTAMTSSLAISWSRVCRVVCRLNLANMTSDNTLTSRPCCCAMRPSALDQLGAIQRRRATSQGVETHQ